MANNRMVFGDEYMAGDFRPMGGGVWDPSAFQESEVVTGATIAGEVVAESIVNNGSAMLEAAIAIASPGDDIVCNIPLRLTTPIVISKFVHLHLRWLVVDMDPSVDAITVNATHASGSFYFDARWKLKLVGGDNCCRNGMVLNGLVLCDMDLAVRCGATEWGVVVNGLLQTKYTQRTEVNSGTMMHPSTMPKEGACLMKMDRRNDPNAGGDIGINANKITVQVSGGKNGFVVENQRATEWEMDKSDPEQWVRATDVSGNWIQAGTNGPVGQGNSVFDITVQGLFHPYSETTGKYGFFQPSESGKPVDIAGCVGVRISKMHVEWVTKETAIRDCVGVEVGAATVIGDYRPEVDNYSSGAGVYDFGKASTILGGTLLFEDCKVVSLALSTQVDSLDTLTSTDVTVEGVSYSFNGFGKLKVGYQTTFVTPPVEAGNSSRNRSMRGPLAFSNLVPGGAMTLPVDELEWTLTYYPDTATWADAPTATVVATPPEKVGAYYPSAYEIDAPGGAARLFKSSIPDWQAWVDQQITAYVDVEVLPGNAEPIHCGVIANGQWFIGNSSDFIPADAVGVHRLAVNVVLNPKDTMGTDPVTGDPINIGGDGGDPANGPGLLVGGYHWEHASILQQKYRIYGYGIIPGGNAPMGRGPVHYSEAMDNPNAIISDDEGNVVVAGNVTIGDGATTTPRVLSVLGGRALSGAEAVLRIGHHESVTASGYSEALGRLDFVSGDASNLGAEAQARIQAIAGAGQGAGGLLAFFTSYWIDPDNLVRRMTLAEQGQLLVGTEVPGQAGVGGARFAGASQFDAAITETGIVSVSISSANHDIALADVSAVRLSPTASGTTVTGFAGGWEGRVVRLFNGSSSIAFALKNFDSGSTTANRTLTPNAADYVVPPQGGVMLQYQASLWRVLGPTSVNTRRTGWGAPTGTATRTTFATSTATTTQLAERLKALIDDLTTHGLIGP